MNALQKLFDLAVKHNCTIFIRTNGHIQIKGKLLVNYYPFSMNQSAYVAGTKCGKNQVSFEHAFKMANNPPDLIDKKVKRKPSYKKIRERMLSKSNKCFWCEKKLTIESSTIDHVIPLSRGGLDNNNNRVLSCPECNQSRGNAMPELEIEK